LIQFNQVEKYYEGSGFSLGAVDFQIDDGEFVFLIGPTEVCKLLHTYADSRGTPLKW
jgi:ABC-type ATPase involved in cell division